MPEPLQERWMARALPKPGWIYVLTNPALPGLVKIGMTKRVKVEPRIREVGTSLPMPSVVAFRCQTHQAGHLEKLLHHRFERRRVHRQREWFAASPREIERFLATVEPSVRWRRRLRRARLLLVALAAVFVFLSDGLTAFSLWLAAAG